MTITDAQGQVVCSGAPQLVQLPTGGVVGEYDSGCTLVCGQTYTVTATNPDCTIHPMNGVQTQAACCPDAAVVNLECDCPPPQPACATPPSGMVAWYPLDEGANASIYQDIAGAVHNAGVPVATFFNPWAVSGMVNGAQYFAGNGANYISVPNHAELDFGTGDFSLDAWVSIVRCYPKNISPIVEKYDATTTVGFSFFVDGQSIHLIINDVQYSSLLVGLSPNTWYHVAVVVDRISNSPTGAFYLNGNPVGTFTPVTGSIDNSEPLQIGMC